MRCLMAGKGLKARSLGFKVRIPPLHVVWSQASYLNLLSLSFLGCKMGVVDPSAGYCQGLRSGFNKKEWSWVICRDVDGCRDCHTEWSKSEWEKQISYINTYMWNLEKWYRWIGLQGRNWDTDVENKRMDTKGGKRQRWWWCDELGAWDWHIYTNMYKMDN